VAHDDCARNAYYGRLARQRLGRKVHERLVDDERAAGEPGDAPADPYDDRDPSGIDWRAAGPRLEAALAALSDELRDVVWFWAVEGLKYCEIAAALDVPIGTAMSRLHRARSRLAAILLDEPAAAPELGRVGVAAASHGPANPRGERP
jgi:DNA-directed RNA polymerase specialized sigma24 family protein